MSDNSKELRRQINLIKDTLGEIIETLHLEENEQFNQLWWLLLKFDISSAEESVISSVLAKYTEVAIADLPAIDSLIAEINARLTPWHRKLNRYTTMQLLRAYRSSQLIAAQKFLQKYHRQPFYLNPDEQNL